MQSLIVTVRGEFNVYNFRALWIGHPPFENGYSSSTIVFRGKKGNPFSGCVGWSKNDRVKAKAYNGVALWLTISKNFNDFEQLIQLAEELFVWSKADYGYATDATKCGSGLYEDLYSLYWLNYFGPAYSMTLILEYRKAVSP